MRDRRLVNRLRSGDMDALGQVYHRYKEVLLTVAMSLMNDRHAAEDCVHDVFVHFAAAPGDLLGVENLRGYLVRCVANRAKTLFKRQRLEPDPPMDGQEGSDRADCPTCRLILSEESIQVFEALAQRYGE